MNVLVLGAAGFVGTNLVRRCVRDGHRVIAVDSLDPTCRSTFDGLESVRAEIEFVRADARDVTLLERLLPGQNAIFNCAAQTSHVLSLADPLRDLELNCATALTVLEAARRSNPDAVHVYPSSSTAVGRFAGVADEDTPQRPRDPYSAHKATVEHYHRIYQDVHGLPVAVLRFANLYGPFGKSDPEFGFVNHFIARALANEEIGVYGEGAQLRNVLFIDDAIEAMFVALRDPRVRGEPYFALGDDELSVRQVAERIVDTIGRGRIATVPFPEDRRRIDTGAARLSDTRFRALTGWRPRVALGDGLVRIRDLVTA